jgi:hypothetical protein
VSEDGQRNANLSLVPPALRRRQPVAVYRVIDEAELLGQSSPEVESGPPGSLDRRSDTSPRRRARARRVTQLGARRQRQALLALVGLTAIVAVATAIAAPRVARRTPVARSSRTITPRLRASSRAPTHASPDRGTREFVSIPRVRARGALPAASHRPERATAIASAAPAASAERSQRAEMPAGTQTTEEFGFER